MLKNKISSETSEVSELNEKALYSLPDTLPLKRPGRIIVRITKSTNDLELVEGINEAYKESNFRITKKIDTRPVSTEMTVKEISYSKKFEIELINNNKTHKLMIQSLLNGYIYSNTKGLLVRLKFQYQYQDL